MKYNLLVKKKAGAKLSEANMFTRFGSFVQATTKRITLLFEYTKVSGKNVTKNQYLWKKKKEMKRLSRLVFNF